VELLRSIFLDHDVCYSLRVSHNQRFSAHFSCSSDICAFLLERAPEALN
jgi:hypothetical protein